MGFAGELRLACPNGPWALLEGPFLSNRILPHLAFIAVIHPLNDSARADNFEAQQKALDLITAAAGKICNVVSTRGEVNSSDVKGNVTVQLRGLASKLAEAGVSGTGSITSEQYENVLRSDLAAALKDNTACRLKVFETLQQKLPGSGPSLEPESAEPGAMQMTPLMSRASRKAETALSLDAQG
jgi:hypothetical protein